MLKNLSRSAALPIAPRAIFARPIEYFSAFIEESEDELDTFQAAYFGSGNKLYFELRKYRSHPENTVTLYLTLSLDENSIISTIEDVTSEFALPWSAVIWFWSESLNALRPILTNESRLREREARELVLKVGSRSPHLTVSMEEIREGVASMYPLSRADRIRSTTRPAEQLWQQILRNVVSHRGGGRSIFSKGLAEKVGNGIRVTRAGLDHLKRSAFLS